MPVMSQNGHHWVCDYVCGLADTHSGYGVIRGVKHTVTILDRGRLHYTYSPKQTQPAIESKLLYISSSFLNERLLLCPNEVFVEVLPAILNRYAVCCVYGHAKLNTLNYVF